MTNRNRVSEATVEEMPLLSPIKEEEASVEVQSVFEDIRHYYQFVPKLYRTLAHYPPLLEVSWRKIKAVMGPGALSPRVKEAIAVVVSQANDCKYCVHIHGDMLRRLKVDSRQIRSLVGLDLDSVDFLDAREKAIVEFAYKINNAAQQVTSEDIEKLREHGVNDGEIVQIFGVVEVYIGYNKLLVALRVEPESVQLVGHGNYPGY